MTLLLGLPWHVHPVLALLKVPAMPPAQRLQQGSQPAPQPSSWRRPPRRSSPPGTSPAAWC